jgi:hypothetical protein
MTGVAELIQMGNDVTRWHTLPTLVPQDLAGHSWGVAMLISHLYPGNNTVKLILIQAALDHDLPESIIGDMPKLARTDDHRDMEDRIAEEMELHSVGLDEHCQNWLKWCDLIEAGLHAKRELALGNQRFQIVIDNVVNMINQDPNFVPMALLPFCKEQGFLR